MPSATSRQNQGMQGMPASGAMMPMYGKENPDASQAPAGLPRTDFVILFVWKEPTSLDNLLGQGDGGGPGAPGGPVGIPRK
jgi:hypothetical protein